MLAAAIGLAGYAGMLAVKRGAAPTAEPRQAATLPGLPPAPERLARVPAVVPASADGLLGAERKLAELQVEVVDVHPVLLRSAGVAVIARSTGVRLGWQTLGEGERAGSGVRLRLAVPAGSHWVCLAHDPAAARHGYVFRTGLELAAGGGEVVLDGALHGIELRGTILGTPAARRVFSVERSDDADWHLPLDLGNTLVSDAAGRLVLRLGSGSYRIAPVAAEELGPVTVRLPGPALVDAEFAPR